MAKLAWQPLYIRAGPSYSLPPKRSLVGELVEGVEAFLMQHSLRPVRLKTKAKAEIDYSTLSTSSPANECSGGALWVKSDNFVLKS